MKIIHFWGFDQEFDQLIKYLDLTKSAIEENQKQFQDWVNDQTKNMDGEEKYTFEMGFEDDYNAVFHDFPRLLYSSFVVTWYSFVEHQLIEICRKSNLRLSISVDDNERLGEGIERAKNFLRKAREYTIDDKHWQKLKYIGKVRNKIVHSSGEIVFFNDTEGFDKQKHTPVVLNNQPEGYLVIEPDFYKYCESQNIIEWGKRSYYRGYINPDYKYCRQLTDFGKTFLNKIDRDLSAKSS